MRLTWRELSSPEYVLNFLQFFLLGFLPAVGIASAVPNGGAVQIHAWPSAPSLFGGSLLGLLMGLRATTTLHTAPPAPGPPTP